MVSMDIDQITMEVRHSYTHKLNLVENFDLVWNQLKLFSSNELDPNVPGSKLSGALLSYSVLHLPYTAASCDSLYPIQITPLMYLYSKPNYNSIVSYDGPFNGHQCSHDINFVPNCFSAFQTIQSYPNRDQRDM